ncbi:MAG: molecular chaperone HtpG [Oscillospiraceae bacterium]|nr:molecular chaperone HtpG [Oscillospiraceae bacterium]
MAKKEFQAESKRLLDLFINSIYTNKESFLREVISNSTDAIDKLCYKALTDESVEMSRDDFKISIATDPKARTLTISDNGIGMTKEELETNLGTIAKSGSLSFKRNLMEQEDIEPDIIGQFGVGFYSCFLVGKRVTVVSRAFGSDEAWQWQSEGADGFEITPAERAEVGTDVTIDLRDNTDDENYDRYYQEAILKLLVRKYSDYIRWPIYVGEYVSNSRIPIWQRTKQEMPDEDCYAYYRDVWHDTKDPVSVLRVDAEGSSFSFRAMLFIPSQVPYEFYTPAYKPGLRLYSSGVLIKEDCAELIPDYFRFVRGVVDSPDLSLNISREALQHDRQLKLIASSLEKKIKAELTRLMNREPEKYDTFYKAFGRQLKYGVMANYGINKDKVKDLLMFYSHNQNKNITLEQYVADMKEGQKHIYYVSADSLAVINGLPQTKYVLSHGYDVLCLTESVDEFVISMLGKFGDRELRSVNNGELDIESKEEKEELEQLSEKNEGVLNFVKEALNGKIVEARLSRKLEGSPCCISARGPVSLEMERHFAASLTPLNEEEVGRIRAERVLEFNPDHPVFGKLCVATVNDKELAEKYCKILYGGALVEAGFQLEDPSEFMKLVCELM